MHIRAFDPHDWYWLASDDRVYSSKRQIITAAADQEYVAWNDDGGTATVWPKDDHGAETNDSLQAVISAYGLRIS